MNARATQLDLSPRGRGRAAKPLTLGEAIELTPADIASLNAERSTKPPALTQIRDRHHALARCIADGQRPFEAALNTGYDASRISILMNDPMFKELVEHYRRTNARAEADFIERTKTLSTTAVARLQDVLENDEELSVGNILEIAKFASDRTGNAPVTKNLNVNVNAGLGDRLKAARERQALMNVTPPPPEEG